MYNNGAHMCLVKKMGNQLGEFFFQVIGTTIEFNGSATFIHNNANSVNGGAIILISYSQIFLNHGANVDFIGNIGRYVCMYVS